MVTLDRLQVLIRVTTFATLTHVDRSCKAGIFVHCGAVVEWTSVYVLVLIRRSSVHWSVRGLCSFNAAPVLVEALHPTQLLLYWSVCMHILNAAPQPIEFTLVVTFELWF